MARSSSSQPTEVEIQILNVLWDHGPSSVREVHNALAAKKETGYSTTLKMMQVMHEKGLLVCDKSVRPQLYRPAKAQEETQLQMLDGIADRVFQGSAMRLAMRMVASGRLSPSELEELQRLAKDPEGEKK